MVGYELLFAKHAADITHLLGGRAYAIHKLLENEIEAESMQGALRAAWIVGQDSDGVKPHYDFDNIVSLIVSQDGRTEISIGSLFEPVGGMPAAERAARVLRLLRDRMHDRRRHDLSPAILIRRANRVAECRATKCVRQDPSTTQILRCTYIH